MNNFKKGEILLYEYAGWNWTFLISYSSASLFSDGIGHKDYIFKFNLI